MTRSTQQSIDRVRSNLSWMKQNYRHVVNWLQKANTDVTFQPSTWSVVATGNTHTIRNRLGAPAIYSTGALLLWLSPNASGIEATRARIAFFFKNCHVRHLFICADLNSWKRSRLTLLHIFPLWEQIQIGITLNRLTIWPNARFQSTFSVRGLCGVYSHGLAVVVLTEAWPPAAVAHCTAHTLVIRPEIHADSRVVP